MNGLVTLVRAWVGCLTTEREQVGAAGKFLRALLLVPVFGILVLALRIRLRLKGPVFVEGKSVFGKTFRCRLPDLIQMYIVLFGRWEPDLTRLIGERLRPGDVFVDVGANIGYFTLLASARVGATGAVVAIDALPANFAELQFNLASNVDTGNVRAINRAVSDVPGMLEVYAGPAYNVGLATTAPGERHHLRREASIVAAPLADLLTDAEIRRTRLVKIDVEGAEPAVLAGMGRFLQECSDNAEILVELSPGWWNNKSLTPEQVIEPLRQAGFNTYLMDNSYWPWRYLWPQVVRRPRRVQRLPEQRVKRIDLVLSRIDAEHL
ncbi:MAG: FkbM family methyltransferase [Stenotrophobium sp.]